MIKAVLFDFDDTLACSWEQKWAHHRHTAKESYGIDLSDETLEEHWGKPYGELVGHLYNHVDTEENMIAANQKTKDLFPKLPIEGAAETIQTLKEQKFPLGIITSTLTSFVLRDLELVSLSADDFFHVQGADDTPFPKPDPRVFDQVLEKLSAKSITKNEVAYVGDSVIDSRAALGAGLTFIAVTTGRDTVEDLRKSGAKHILKDISKLPEFVFSNNLD